MLFDYSTAYFIAGLTHIFIPLLIWWLLSQQKNPQIVWWSLGGLSFGMATLWVPMNYAVPQPIYGAISALLFVVGFQLKARTLWSFLETNWSRRYWLTTLVAYVLVAVVLAAQKSLIYSQLFTVLTHLIFYGYLAWLAWRIYRKLGQRSALGICSSYAAVVILLITVLTQGLLGHQDSWKTGASFAVLIMAGILIVFVNHIAFMGMVLERRLRIQSQKSPPIAEVTSDSGVIERLFWNAERERVLAGMARRVVHEINQPLTSLSSTVSLMQRALRDDRWAEVHGADLIDRMDTSLKQASHVVSQIRLLAKGTAMNVRPIDLNALVQESVDLMNLPKNQIHFEPTTDWSGDFRLRGNRLELLQVLVNLLRNAMQAADSQARVPEIRISLLRDDAQVCIVLTDNGPGFDKEIWPKLGREIFSTKMDGMGIGLWISKDIIEAHSGQLFFQNLNDAQGAQVKVCLPLSLED